MSNPETESDSFGSLVSDPDRPSAPPEGQKRCADCGIEKFKSQFPPNRKTQDGLDPLCYLCRERRRNETRSKRAERRFKRLGGDVDAMVDEFEAKGMSRDFLGAQLMDIIGHTDNDATRLAALRMVAELYGFNFKQGGDSKDERDLIQSVLRAKREAEADGQIHATKKDSPTG